MISPSFCSGLTPEGNYDTTAFQAAGGDGERMREGRGWQGRAALLGKKH